MLITQKFKFPSNDFEKLCEAKCLFQRNHGIKENELKGFAIQNKNPQKPLKD